jgi:hypothetical protein
LCDFDIVIRFLVSSHMMCIYIYIYNLPVFTKQNNPLNTKYKWLSINLFTNFLFDSIHSPLNSQLQDNRPDGSASEIGAAGPRNYLIGGNWKCNGTWDENADRVTVFNEAGPIPSNVEVAICVPDMNIPQLLTTLRKDIAVGAQNCGVNKGDGAFTGETGSHQLKDLGVIWVIIGHSERREGFGMVGETVGLCAEKCKVAIDNGLKVMFVSIAFVLFLGNDQFRF